MSRTPITDANLYRLDAGPRTRTFVPAAVARRIERGDAHDLYAVEHRLGPTGRWSRWDPGVIRVPRGEQPTSAWLDAVRRQYAGTGNRFRLRKLN